MTKGGHWREIPHFNSYYRVLTLIYMKKINTENSYQHQKSEEGCNQINENTAI